jgi:hypothetical protein
MLSWLERVLQVNSPSGTQVLYIIFIEIGHDIAADLCNHGVGMSPDLFTQWNSELMVDRRDDGPKEFDICHEREEWVKQRHIPSFMPVKY